MKKNRRVFMSAIAAIPLAGCQSTKPQLREQKSNMYGLIGKIKVRPGQRDLLSSILLTGTNSMPGCLSYIIANDPQDPDALWITEVWDSPEAHSASMSLPAVKKALSEGRPLIVGFGERFETKPLGGYGLLPGIGGG
jgi:quinol monooxygenase YgiN